MFTRSVARTSLALSGAILLASCSRLTSRN